METKFTKGEWKLHISPIWEKARKFHIFPPEGGYAICSRDFQYDMDCKPYENHNEVIANAKLISKSPEMFETITNFIHWIEREKETVSGALLAEMDSAKRLIKKITE
jgi:hypothetical protein